MLRAAIRAARWRERHISDNAAAFIVATVTGLAAGTGAFVLKWMVASVTRFLTHGLRLDGANWIFLLIPVAGIILTGIYVRYILRDDITHGVSKLMADLRKRIYKLRLHLTYSPLIASTLTLGFGGSAGSEGPIAYAGAAMGSNLARLARFSPQLMMIMVGCGAGAGIAGIFKAPVGGFLFTLEVLRMELTTVSVIALFTACIVAGMTAFALSGFTYDLNFPGVHLFEPSMSGWYVALGIFCGLYALYYSAMMRRMQHVYGSVRSPWLRNLAGGAVLALSIFLFPSLYGGGYGVMGHLLCGEHSAITAGSLFYGIAPDAWALIIVAGAILLVKTFACSASNSAGGVAGDFAPTLFAGCIAGLFFALTVNKIFDAGLPVSHFAFVAMAGVMAGIVRAPLMALFLAVEMTGCETLFLPALIVAGISFGVVKLSTRADFYAYSHLRRSLLEKHISSDRKP